MDEFDAQIGANDLQVLTAETGPVIGVKFVGQPTGLNRLAQAIQEALRPLIWIELAMHTEAGVIIDQSE